MDLKKWLILFFSVIVIAIFLFAKFLIPKDKLVDSKNINIKGEKHMKIESNIFLNDGKIPIEYTCDGESTQIPLKISNAPLDAKSLALIVDDPDAPGGDFVHWIVWNINPKTSIIGNGKIPDGAMEGYMSLGGKGYFAPCPPSGIHHYNFKLYALDTILSLPESSTKLDLINAMNGHVIDNAILTGLYGRN